MCDEVQLALSAQLDGEPTGADPERVREHLSGCTGCAQWWAGAQRLAGTPQLAGVLSIGAVEVPDLTEQIMAAVAVDRASNPPVAAPRVVDEAQARQQILRLAVACAAVVQLALAVPALVSAFVGPGVGVGLHASREMASFDVAVAVGFLLAAVRPGRARTFLPVAVVLACCLATTSGIDLARGATTVAHEIGHLVALAQAGLLWALTRSDAHTHSASTDAPANAHDAGPVTA